MKFTLCTVLLVFAIPASAWQDLSTDEASPLVLSMDLPAYDFRARAAGVVGEVTLGVSTDGERVTEIVTKVEAHPSLTSNAVDNVRSWVFRRHEPTSFDVTYLFRVDESLKNEFSIVRTLKLPFHIELAVGRMPMLIHPPSVPE